MSAPAIVIGASGLVGGALLRALGPSAVGTYRSRPTSGLRRVDAADPGALAALFREIAPRIVYFPAAEPNVDWCERWPEQARAANVAPALAALDAARSVEARFVFFSSDYIFDGRSGPYDEDAAPHPMSVYGAHKREVERGVLATSGTVVRTTTVFGREFTPPGKNFVLQLVRRLRAEERVRVPVDQWSTPTWSDDLARAAVPLAWEPGIWNVAGPDLVARDELARRVARAFDLDASLITPVPTSALEQVAPRPLRGGLRTKKLAERIGRGLTPVDDALRALREQLES